MTIEQSETGEAQPPIGRAESTLPHPWPIMDSPAYYGLPGQFAKAVEPFSEADPVGILLHTLIAGGCLIGPSPFVSVEHTRHHARTNLICIGRTAGGRKGTAWGIVRYLFSQVDVRWATDRVMGGLSSGEGLIYQVRDAEGDDPGEVDKRLFVVEPEFASALKVMEREGNTLSAKIREAWDQGTLRPMTKRERLTATGAHICIVGHITQDELVRSMTATERANGFANRFLFALLRRSKFLPLGKGAPPAMLDAFAARFQRVTEWAQRHAEITRDAEADALWEAIYSKIEEEIPGLPGAIQARAAAQVLRLSLLYCLLDEGEIARPAPAIRCVHLLAAIAVWDYCKASVAQIFGTAIGDPIADRLLRAIQICPQTDSDLYQVLGRRDGGRKEPALDLLRQFNRVHAVKRATDGRPVQEWHFGTEAGCALCVKRV
jgi:hypothetical protein